MGNPDFDKPTKNSLLEAKEHWEDLKKFAQEQLKEVANDEKTTWLDDIKTADENLADILPRLAEFDQLNYIQSDDSGSKTGK